MSDASMPSFINRRACASWLALRTRSDEMIDFTWLKRVLGLTDAISAPIWRPWKRRTMSTSQSFVDNRPRTRIKATASGAKPLPATSPPCR